jgi:hypothetical protein
MGGLIFATLLTVAALALIVATFDQMRDWERAAVVLLPVFGAFFMWASWRDLRRRRSLHTQVENGVTVYVWVEFDGSPCRSTRDPRPDWDGDGDGGDGGD